MRASKWLCWKACKSEISTHQFFPPSAGQPSLVTLRPNSDEKPLNIQKFIWLTSHWLRVFMGCALHTMAKLLVYCNPCSWIFSMQAAMPLMMLASSYLHFSSASPCWKASLATANLASWAKSCFKSALTSWTNWPSLNLWSPNTTRSPLQGTTTFSMSKFNDFATNLRSAASWRRISVL